MMADRVALADWFLSKWRQRLQDSEHAYFAVATQMRKQGIPLSITLAVLVNRGAARNG